MHVAVITGASMGLGEVYARQLAARKENLVLIARSADRLHALAAELERVFHVKPKVFPCDLSAPDAAQRIAAYLAEHGLHPKWLVNNAGFGVVGPLDSQEPEAVHGMMMVNMVALVDLTRALLPQMRLIPDARIINVASTASFQPVPFFNVYAATKVFVLHFSEALAEELRGSNVRVHCVCPGPTPTNFHVSSNMDPKIFQKGQSAEDVVRWSLEASDRGQVLLICQRRFATVLQKLLPRALVRFLAGKAAKHFLKMQGKTIA